MRNSPEAAGEAMATSKLSFLVLGCHTSNAKRDVTELEKAAFHYSTATFATLVPLLKYFMLLDFRIFFP